MRKWLIFAVGALPIAGLAVASHYLPTAGDDDTVRLGVCTGLGALWGFAAGVLRRSLMRAIVGLNFGALCGYLFFFLGVPDKAADEVRAILALVTSGAMLGCALNFRRDSLMPGLRGLAAGALSFGFMACAAWVVAKFFDPTIIGWTVMCLVPFGGGMAIFIGLVGAEPLPVSVATEPPGATLAQHDYERGRTTQTIADATRSNLSSNPAAATRRDA